MSRRRRRRSAAGPTGLLLVDKPSGITSHDVVSQVRRLTGQPRVGHAGTLDPLATGVLPIALGEATKTVSWVMDGTKSYRYTVCWGEARATDDLEGAVTETSDVRPTRDEILGVLDEF